VRTAQIHATDISESATPAPQFVTFRATPLRQLIGAVIYAVTFGVAYILMLLAVYYNGYILISIFVGAGFGKFLCDWKVQEVSIGSVRSHHNGCTVRTNGTAPNRPFWASRRYQIEGSVRSVL
jgi:Ctr copper transporter family